MNDETLSRGMPGDDAAAASSNERPGQVPRRLGIAKPVEQLALGPAQSSPVERGIEIPLSGEGRPLSSAQQRLWFLDRLEGDSVANHLAMALRLRGELRVEALQAALDAIVSRQEVLRAVYIEVDGQPMQQIRAEGCCSLEQIDLQRQDQKWLLERLSHELDADFDLSTGPLIRGSLFQLGPDDHILVIAMHQIVSDDWSRAVLFRELVVLYRAYFASTPDPLPPLPIQFADYAAWHRQSLTEPQVRGQLQYWKDQLQGAPALIDLPTDRLRPATQSGRGASVPVVLGLELTQKLKALSRQLDLTLSMTLYAAWSILLMRLSGQQDVVIGVRVAGRARPEFELLIGFFANTLPVRVRCEDDLTVLDLLSRTKEILIGAQAHQDVPFERVVDALQPLRTLSYSPVFQVMFVFDEDSTHALELPGLSIEAVDIPVRASQFDLSLTLHGSTEEIRGSLNYASDLFDDATIRRWVGHFMSVLEGMARSPYAKASKISLLCEHQRYQVTESFNSAHAAYPRDKLIQEIFEAQVARTPDAIAVVHQEQSLTYAQLNGRANQLARCLRARGVDRDELVGLCTTRSVEMLVGILGVWKAGGAYVPLDPQYPTERLAFMIEDSMPKVLLTQRRLCERLPPTGIEVVVLDEWTEIGTQEAGNLELRAFDKLVNQLAYVIYTSGSTGRPKGVMIEHDSVLNLWAGLEPLYEESRCERVGLNASLNFDASVQQVVQLLSGRRLYLIDEEERRDAELLLSLVEEHGIEGIDCTPSQLRSWVSAGLLERPGPLRVVLVGGEAIDPELWNALSCCAWIEFYNVYGPTECTVDATIARLRGDQTSPHVGRPMPNRRVLILDRQGQLLPVGLAGEIYIGGVGVARGYLNRPELTEDRFVRDPSSTDDHKRMYRTGDLGRWRADGAIQYLGRNDQQVKIRGFRMELGEIEAQLLGHDRVEECVVLAREDVPGEKCLVAYVVCVGDSDGAIVEVLRSNLRSTLPEYMIPSAFVLLQGLPLTPNGKVDRRALPAPELEAYAVRQYEAPLGGIEEILAGIWQSLLGIARVGRQDNFFELGGHSLLIVQMMERLRRVGLSTLVQEVFDHPTLADLAKVLAHDVVEETAIPPNQIPPDCAKIEPQMLPLVALEPEHIECIVKAVPGGAVNVQDIYPLVALQEGILFHHMLDERRGDTYVLSVLLLVSSKVRIDELISALQGAIDRHDVLRTAIVWEDLPRPLQIVYRRATLPVTEVELHGDRDARFQVNGWLAPERQRLDLRQAPLMRLQVAADPHSQQYYALLQLHHIVSDHLTLESITAEVVAHLQGQQLSASAPYRNHVAQSLAYALKHDSDAFFRRKLEDITDPTAPFAVLDVHGDSAEGLEADEKIEPELAQRIRVQSRSRGITPATLFHASWGLVVAHTSARDDVVFGSLLLGRLHGSAGSQRTLGMLINTLPLRLRLHGVTARALIQQTQRELVELLNHEQASLSAAQRCSGIVGSAPLFTTLLNYRHTTTSFDAQWAGAPGVRLLTVRERTNYPITLSVDDLGEGFTLSALTDRRIDPQRVTGYLHTAVRSLVQALEQAPETLALSLSILPADERRQLIDVLNATHPKYISDRRIHELFEEQVRRTPGAVATTYDQQALTYVQLNRKANQLARHLRGKGVGADTLVGICVERSLEMVVGLLGILKAGGAYLPLDPNYPPDRLRYMLQDAAPKVVLTRERLKASLPATSASVIALDTMRHELERLDAEDILPSELGLTAASLIYVIYTSGSTGRPKGTAMSHGAMSNLIEWHRRDERLGQPRRVLQFAALSFDVAFQDTFSTLCTGGTLVLLDERVRKDARALIELLQDRSIERLFVPPLMLQSIAECCDSQGTDLASLRDVITAGEQLRIGPEVVSLFTRLSDCRLHNHYGPTEAHVVTAFQLVGEPEQWPVLPPIGRPIANTQIYILNERREPAPLGVAGDVYIGGAGLARGYLNRAALTAERFIPDPFSADGQQRLYKTGDVGRWRTDGTIEYLGRNDYQVKIRGFRIELGEIEAQLALCEHVKNVAVLAREDVPGQKRLVAYVTPRDHDRDPSAEDMRTHLTSALPEHMVPSAFVVLKDLPLTSSGKLNPRALPAPEMEAYVSRAYESPRGEVEEILAGIWQSVLGVERVGSNDNFFELGGHSLLVLTVILKINRAFKAELRVSDAYKNPTVSEMARRVLVGADDDGLVDLKREAELPEDIVVKPGTLGVPSEAILLTGATGFVGRFLLAQLIKDTNATVYCLVRAESQDQAVARLRSTLEKWELWRDDSEQRLVTLAGDLRLPWLGLDESTYRMLGERIDSIYHCGASMNHLETYTMAKPANVNAAKELVRLATIQRPKLINYISTLGVFSPVPAQTGRVVQELTSIDHERHSHARGYAASKWVSEKIFLTASERGVACNIFRLGVIWADSQLGRYDEMQREYRILKSSLLSGYGIRDYRYDPVPLPVDYAARAVVFLANKHHSGGGVFHISTDSTMSEGVFEQCSEIAGASLELVPFFDWISEIKRLHCQGRSLPVVPLIEFAFSMDEHSFAMYQHNLKLASVRADCVHTRLELDEAGIIAPPDLNVDACLASVCFRDAEVSESPRIGTLSAQARMLRRGAMVRQ